MRVRYRPIMSRSPGGALYVTYKQIGEPDFCCEEMRDEWDILIGFGIKGHRETSVREVNIFTTHHQTTGTVIPGITEIRWCPFCGEMIEIVPEQETR